MKILIVDDNELNRDILDAMLSDDYEIIMATNGIEALEQLAKHSGEITLMLLDAVMPLMDGFTVLKNMREYGYLESIPVIMISAETGTEYVEKAFDLGAVDFVQRPFASSIVHRRVNNTISLFAKQQKLRDQVVAQIIERDKSNRHMVEILSHIVEFRNGESGKHVKHVQTFTELFMRKLVTLTDKYEINEADINEIVLASALHDVGKIAIPSEILNKPGRLTDEEFDIMRTHSAVGFDMLSGLGEEEDMANDVLLKYARQITRHHHERWDGRGYPDKLKEDEIPVAAQVVSMADVYDALTSPRCYKPAYTHEKAVDMILNGECGQFNPLLIRALNELNETIKSAFTIADSAESLESIANALNEADNSSKYLVNELNSVKARFTSMLNGRGEMMFSYSPYNPVVELSDTLAAFMDTKTNVTVAEFKSGMDGRFSKDMLDDMTNALSQLTPKDSELTANTYFAIKGEKKEVQITFNALFAKDALCGVIGTVKSL